MNTKKTHELAEYIVYLPLYYNDGRKIEAKKLEMTEKEIVKEFGACTRQRENKGIWVHQNKTYSDEINRLEVLTSDTEENDAWFRKYKIVLKKRFKQEEIFVKKMRGIEKL